jgi:hypothetical protein
MKFIYVKKDNEALKEVLIQKGYRSLGFSGDFIIFENNENIKFNFSEFDKSSFVFSSNLLF